MTGFVRNRDARWGTFRGGVSVVLAVCPHCRAICRPQDRDWHLESCPALMLAADVAGDQGEPAELPARGWRGWLAAVLLGAERGRAAADTLTARWEDNRGRDTRNDTAEVADAGRGQITAPDLDRRAIGQAHADHSGPG